VVEVKDVTFEEDSNGGRIDLKFSGNARWKVERPDDRSAVLTIESAKLPKRLERSLDTSALDTPVKMISAFSVAGATERVRLVVAGNGALDETVVQTPTGLAWRLSVKGVKTEESAVNAKTAGFVSEPARYAEQGAPQRQRWVGKKVSFEFKDIELHNLLRIIAEVSKKNIVVADDVGGKVTIRLRNVPWDQAFDLILRSKQLGKEDLGNIVRVAPLKVLEEEAKLREERAKSMKRQEDLVVQLVPVNYATAAEMSTRVKDILSERGTVSVDTRTNTLIVRDVASNIGRARSLVQTLDTQTPQVLIEARIIEANTTYTKQVGVQWGGSSQFAPGTGNATGLTFPNSVAMRGGSTSEGTAGTATSPDFAVNLPASVGTGAGGALGFVFGSAGGALALNLRLSAMENQGTVKTISAPKVTTLDNVGAKISQGVSVPFSQTSASGTSTSFIEARLSLDVTPHVTQDGSILMTINAQNNQPDPSATGANGQPSIQRKEASTQVLVKDGDTTVIGGIYVKRGSNTSSSVPFFGRIPVLGWFFRDSKDSESRTELLIFISPRIINRQTVAQNL
jgi:type IV pilus assembly protein PilQ